MHAIWMQTPSGGVQMPQLALQHTSPISQVTGPQGSPNATSSSGKQNCCVQTAPIGAHMEQLSLQQYSPSPHHAWPQGVPEVGSQ